MSEYSRGWNDAFRAVGAFMLDHEKPESLLPPVQREASVIRELGTVVRLRLRPVCDVVTELQNMAEAQK